MQREYNTFFSFLCGRTGEISKENNSRDFSYNFLADKKKLLFKNNNCAARGRFFFRIRESDAAPLRLFFFFPCPKRQFGQKEEKLKGRLPPFREKGRRKNLVFGKADLGKGKNFPQRRKETKKAIKKEGKEDE